MVNGVRENLWPYLSGVSPRRHTKGISKSATATKKWNKPRLLIIEKISSIRDIIKAPFEC
jgi:hypothetical protein